jgi:hypothetical protein
MGTFWGAEFLFYVCTSVENPMLPLTGGKQELPSKGDERTLADWN